MEMVSLLLRVLLSLLGILSPVLATTQVTSIVSAAPVNTSDLLAPALLSTNIINTFVHQPDNETIASFSQSGLCMAYLGRILPGYEENWNRNKSLSSCQNYCSKEASSDGYGVSAPVSYAFYW